MNPELSIPATADIRHGYARHNAQNGPSWAHDETYQRDLRQFDRWLARQLELAVQGERARNAKAGNPYLVNLMAALVLSYGEPDHETDATMMYVWDEALTDTDAEKVVIVPDPIRRRTVIRVIG